jgi:hypothetical protein
VEAEVRHHRHRDARLATMQRPQGDQLVAVDHRAFAIDRQDAVPVAVEGEPGLVTARADAIDQRPQMGRSARCVDVAPVGAGVEHVELGPEAAEDLRPGARRRARGRSRWPRAARTGPGRRSAPRARAGSPRVRRQRTHPADARPGTRRILGAPCCATAASISSSAASESLKPSPAEELDPVVGVRVVRGGDDDAEVEPVAAISSGRRRREHAARAGLPARGGHAGGHRALEHLARLARVADDEDRGALAGSRSVAAGPERERQLGGQELARDPADAVRAEERARQSAGR